MKTKLLLSKNDIKNIMESPEAKKVMEFNEFERKRQFENYLILDDFNDLFFYMLYDFKTFELKNPNEKEKIKKLKDRLDKIEKIKDKYQFFHYSAERHIRKNYELECRLLELSYKIKELQNENEKLNLILKSDL